ncbi:MAG: hypothetical protein FWH29_02025 [Methanobrevibacter sp.]|nr:hypothetical protein [Methanobrevibacter sp.]
MSIETISIKPDLLKTISNIAKKEGINENQALNEIIEKGIEAKIKTKNKIPNYLIANKDTYNPYPERFLNSAGMIKGCKPFSAVKLVKQMRSGDYDIP